MIEGYDHLPELSDAMDVLARYLSELGMASNNGMGITKISWEELKSWRDLTCTFLTSHEAIILICASQTYATAVSEYNEKSIDAPFSAILSKEDQAILDEKEARKMEIIMDRTIGMSDG